MQKAVFQSKRILLTLLVGFRRRFVQLEWVDLHSLFLFGPRYHLCIIIEILFQCLLLELYGSIDLFGFKGKKQRNLVRKRPFLR